MLTGIKGAAGEDVVVEDPTEGPLLGRRQAARRWSFESGYGRAGHRVRGYGDRRKQNLVFWRTSLATTAEEMTSMLTRPSFKNMIRPWILASLTRD